jgi:hypothetical protein
MIGFGIVAAGLILGRKFYHLPNYTLDRVGPTRSVVREARIIDKWTLNVEHSWIRRRKFDVTIKVERIPPNDSYGKITVGTNDSDVLTFQSLRAGKPQTVDIGVDLRRVENAPEDPPTLSYQLSHYVGKAGDPPGAPTFSNLTELRIEAPVSRTWLGLDLGDSGCVIAYAAGDDTPAPISFGRAANLNVVESLVYVLAPSELRHLPLDDELRQAARPILWGPRVLGRDLGAPERCFESPKRLISDPTPRRVRLDDDSDFNAKQAVRLLANNLLDSIPMAAVPARNLALVIPNRFAPREILDLTDCVKSRFDSIRTIHATDAAIVNYLGQVSHAQHDQALLNKRKGAGERILVVDFGASNLDVTCARVGRDGSGPFNIHILSALGYGFGGIDIDWEIRRVLWSEFLKSSHGERYRNAEPWESIRSWPPQKRHEWYVDRTKFRKICEISKLHASKLWNRNQENVSWKPFQVAADENQGLREWSDIDFEITPAELVTKVPEVRNVVYQAVREAIEISRRIDPIDAGSDTVDSLLLLGGSLNFCGVRETILQAVRLFQGGLDPMRIRSFDKTSAANGAAVWAAREERMQILREYSSAHLGMVRKNEYDVETFLPLVEAGSLWSDQTQLRILQPRADHTVRLYQVFGPEPQEALRNKETFRFSAVLECTNVHQEGPITVSINKINGILDGTIEADAVGYQLKPCPVLSTRDAKRGSWKWLEFEAESASTAGYR